MVTDVTLINILLMWLISKWNYHTIEVKTDFLNALIEEEIYMKILKAMT